MIYFIAHTFKCVCHCRRAIFRVLDMYNFGCNVGTYVPPSIKYVSTCLFPKKIEDNHYNKTDTIFLNVQMGHEFYHFINK